MSMRKEMFVGLALVVYAACGGREFEALEGSGLDGGSLVEGSIVEGSIVEAPVEGGDGAGGGGGNGGPEASLDAQETEAEDVVAVVDGGAEAEAEASVLMMEASVEAAVEATIDTGPPTCPVIHIVRAVFGSNCDEVNGCPSGSYCISDDVTDVVQNGDPPSTACEGAKECIYFAGAGCTPCFTQGCPRAARIEYECVGPHGSSSRLAYVPADAWAAPMYLKCEC
jgi:hypothetical protein